MREVIVYRTKSWYRTKDWNKVSEIRTFETKTAARKNAIKDMCNSNFTLYKVTVTINGIITEKEEKIGKIKCGIDIARGKK